MTKRLIVILLGAMALIVSLVAGPATAGEPYPGTVRTSTDVDAPQSVKAGKSVTIRVTVRTQGSGRPEGTITLSLTGPGGFSKTMRSRYDGRVETFETGKLKKPGKYKVVATFSGGDSVFKDSRDSDTITVKKKKD